MRKNKVKARLAVGEQVIGSFVKCGDPAIVEVMGYAGFDFVVIDNAHANLDRQETLNLIRAAELVGIEPIVRVSINDAEEILHALDSGAMGVQIPMVNSLDAAHQAVANCKYAPVGERGFASTPRANQYGFGDVIDYGHTANDEIMVIIYAETKGAIELAPETVKIPGLDVVFMGPFDLSQSYGHIGEAGHPDVVNGIQSVIDATQGYPVVAGTIAGSPQQAQDWLDRGIQFLVYSSDLGLMGAAAKSALASITRRS